MSTGFYKTRVGYNVYVGRTLDGKRSVFRRVKTLHEAQQMASLYRQVRTDQDKMLLSLSNEAKYEILCVLKLAIKNGTTLSALWKAWKERYGDITGKTLKTCVELFLNTMEDKNRRASYTNSVRQILSVFTNLYGDREINTITIGELESFLSQYGEKSKSTVRNRLSTFLGWCQKKDFCSDNLALRLDVPHIDKEIPHVLALGEILILLQECPLNSLGALILMLFGGIRPLESKQIRWEDIDLQSKLITISSNIAKTRAFRHVPISPNMLEWLKYYKKNGGDYPFAPAVKYVTRGYASILKLDSWPRDCLRHTAASMMLARDSSAEKIALDLGNSTGVIHRNYKNLVSIHDCNRFWTITPENIGRK